MNHYIAKYWRIHGITGFLCLLFSFFIPHIAVAANGGDGNGRIISH